VCNLKNNVGINGYTYIKRETKQTSWRKGLSSATLNSPRPLYQGYDALMHCCIFRLTHSHHLPGAPIFGFTQSSNWRNNDAFTTAPPNYIEISAAYVSQIAMEPKKWFWIVLGRLSRTSKNIYRIVSAWNILVFFDISIDISITFWIRTFTIYIFYSYTNTIFIH